MIRYNIHVLNNQKMKLTEAQQHEQQNPQDPFNQAMGKYLVAKNVIAEGKDKFLDLVFSSSKCVYRDGVRIKVPLKVNKPQKKANVDTKSI